MKTTHLNSLHMALESIVSDDMNNAIHHLSSIKKNHLVEYLNAQILLGKIYSQLNRYTEAEHCLQQVPRYHPEYIDVQIELAHLYAASHNRRYQESIDCYRTVPPDHEEYLDIQLFLGELYTETDQYELATQSLLNVLNHIDRADNFNKKIDAIEQLTPTKANQASLKEASTACSEQTFFRTESTLKRPLLIDLQRLLTTYQEIEFARKQLSDDSHNIISTILDKFEQVPESSRFYHLAQAEIAAIYARNYDWEAAEEISAKLSPNRPATRQLNKLIEEVKRDINSSCQLGRSI